MPMNDFIDRMWTTHGDWMPRDANSPAASAWTPQRSAPELAQMRMHDNMRDQMNANGYLPPGISRQGLIDRARMTLPAPGAQGGGAHSGPARPPGNLENTQTGRQPGTTVVNPNPQAPAQPAQPAAGATGDPRTDAIQSAYANILGRNADPEGLQYWLHSGLDHDQIAAALAASPEATQRRQGEFVSSSQSNQGSGLVYDPVAAERERQARLNAGFGDWAT